MTGWIAISAGDATGIGPEVTLKALAAELSSDDSRYLVVGDAGQMERLNAQLGLKLPLQSFPSRDEPGRVFVHSPLPPLPTALAAGCPAAADASR